MQDKEHSKFKIALNLSIEEKIFSYDLFLIFGLK